ncbi:MAG: hypothetical protein JNM00_02655 [Flavobacteriales bacterium]|nr:hypothetical protein [Flavobacteriales bacterium]
MLDTPVSIQTLFVFTTVLTLILFIVAVGKGHNELTKKRTNATALVVLGWSIFMATLALNGYFMIKNAMPPKLMVMIGTCLIFFLLLFNIKSGKKFIDGIDGFWLTALHIVRIPVEIGLWWLAAEKLVPLAVTFEGSNFDIISGITAPIMAWLVLKKEKSARKILIAWNFLALALLLNVVITAALSLPSPMQQLNFDQPMRAVTSFPYMWLPTIIVPLVLFSHLAMLRRLLWTRA